MLSKTAFTIIYVAGVAWFLGAAIYTFKSVIKDALSPSSEE